MKFLDLKKIVSDLKVISQDDMDFEITSICDLANPAESNLLFIKNKKFLLRVLDSRLPRLGFIICEKLCSEAGELAKFGPLFIASTAKINLSIGQISKPFYDNKYSIEGLEEAEIDSTTTIHAGASVGKNVKIEADVVIYPGAIVMDNCTIGAGSVLYPNCTLYPFTKLGKKARVHSGVVIGADGFGYHFDNGVHHKVWHMGGVDIGDDVEVGANSQIDSGTFSPTLIGDGCKFDNNVQIGHNCVLGKGVLICGHVAIGGSSTLGDYTVFGGKSGMGDNMKLGNACKVAGGALVNADWPDGTILGGHPARPLREWMRGIAYLRKESLKK